ncbi:MAG: DUF448 domain-containing protein [Alphaproteobacteria bacterium]|nr:DUF448 domain-containing protein [Alphaproteobacteria bacterium]
MPARPRTPEGEAGPERRCLASGRVAAKGSLIRLVVDPDGKAVPDLDAKLPGRGHYLAPERPVVERAEAKGLIRRATGAEVEPGLADRLEALLVRRLVERIGLARKAGQAVAGFEKVREHLKAGGTEGAVLLEASDGAADGRAKLVPLAPGAAVVDCLNASELAQAFGREHTVHGFVARGAFAERIRLEAERLRGLRKR